MDHRIENVQYGLYLASWVLGKDVPTHPEFPPPKYIQRHITYLGQPSRTCSMRESHSCCCCHLSFTALTSTNDYDRTNMNPLARLLLRSTIDAPSTALSYRLASDELSWCSLSIGMMLSPRIKNHAKCRQL